MIETERQILNREVANLLRSPDFSNRRVNLKAMPGPKRTEPVFLDTPRGLITPAGAWFRTSASRLEASYPEVLARTELAELVYRAEVWLNSHRSVALVAVALLLLVVPPGWAIIVGVLVFFGWLTVAPSLGNRALGRILEWLGWAPIQVTLYVVVLSLFGARDQHLSLLCGVGWFVVIRWRLLDFLSRPMADAVFRRLYKLPVPDQMLRAVIFSEAIRLGIPLEGFPSIARWLDSGEDDQDSGP
jgi:hypothetical protein